MKEKTIFCRKNIRGSQVYIYAEGVVSGEEANKICRNASTKYPGYLFFWDNTGAQMYVGAPSFNLIQKEGA